MSEPAPISAVTADVVKNVEATLVTDRMSHAPAFITVQEVAFSTAASVSLRPPTISRRVIDAIRVVRAALHRAPARRHHLPRSNYLEGSRMAREMDRL
jgi:hypothetical protein